MYLCISRSSVYRKHVITCTNQHGLQFIDRDKIKSKTEASGEFCMTNKSSSKTSSPYNSGKVFSSHQVAMDWMKNFSARFPRGELPFLKLLYSNVAHGSLLCLADQHSCNSFLSTVCWKIPPTELFCKFLLHMRILSHTQGGIMQVCFLWHRTVIHSWTDSLFLPHSYLRAENNKFLCHNDRLVQLFSGVKGNHLNY